jgi:hypothetical protein
MRSLFSQITKGAIGFYLEDAIALLIFYGAIVFV